MGGLTMALESVHGEGDEEEAEETPITRHSSRSKNAEPTRLPILPFDRKKEGQANS